MNDSGKTGDFFYLFRQTFSVKQLTMEEDSDDPVVKEIDVYLSKQLEKKLYLLQYPVRPGQMTYDDTEFLAARIKPKQQKLEVEVSVNTRSSNYDASKGEQVGF